MDCANFFAFLRVFFVITASKISFLVDLSASQMWFRGAEEYREVTGCGLLIRTPGFGRAFPALPPLTGFGVSGAGVRRLVALKGDRLNKAG